MGRESFWQGLDGEAIAQKYLAEQGYRIIGLNFSSQQGEIDIIAWEANYLVFVEVKNYSFRCFGSPLMAVNRAKRAGIIHAARTYLYKNNIKDVDCRFDVVAIYRLADGSRQIELYKHAFMIN
ncbi:YraN family protein [Candidatus Saganbacteria bacterium]|nr:YraN family protein [Candidatus Saganbacteria bacterium]